VDSDPLSIAAPALATGGSSGRSGPSGAIAWERGTRRGYALRMFDATRLRVFREVAVGRQIATPDLATA
jgi:hypothetical protein